MHRFPVIIIVLWLLPLAGLTQSLINDGRPAVKKKLEKHMTDNDSIIMKLTESDTTITLSIRDPKVQPADFTYHFDASGRCHLQIVKASCDSCFQKFLQGVLSNKKYQWKQINGNQYVSKYRTRLMIEVPPENRDHSYRILRTGWTRKSYRILMQGN